MHLVASVEAEGLGPGGAKPLALLDLHGSGGCYFGTKGERKGEIVPEGDNGNARKPPSGKNRRVEDEPLMTEAEAARLLRVSVRTLKRWRLEGGEGPTVAGYVGRSPRYKRSELLRWIRRPRGS